MKSSQKGFSLVEIMVALVIGMISMIVIMQVFYVSEGRKRSTTGGADAQSNGAIAFYMLERDTKMAGWGIDSASYATCGTVYSYCDGSAVCGGVAGNIGTLRFASVIVADGGTGPDRITAQYFANPVLDTYRYPSTTTITSPMPQPSSEFNVGSVAGCAANDMALVSQAGKCTLMTVTHIQGAALKIQHNPGGNAPYNPSANHQNTNNWPAYTQGATVSCFKAPPNGPVFAKTYFIDTATRQLRRNDNTTLPIFPATTAVPIVNELVAPEIIDLQVQYGIAPVGSQEVNDWVDPSGATWGDPALANWKRIKAVRIALVSRSSQYEKPEPGQTCNATPVGNVGPAWAGLTETKLTNQQGADYRCYRYKVFESVIPLRNVIWAKL